jgi:ABC-type glycerol-3-phosphate transport system substrate-binding protein
MPSHHSNSPADPDPGPAWSRRRLLQGTAAFAGLAAFGPALPAYGAQATDAQAAPEGVTLKVLVNTPHLTAYTGVLAAGWAQKTGGKVEVTAVSYDQLTSQQIADVQSGAGEYDIFDYLYYGLGSLVEAGALVDMTGWIARNRDFDTRDFLPSIYDPYTLYQGRRYGLPFDGCQHLVYYNKEILDRYDLQPPAAWDEYDAVAKKVTQANRLRWSWAAPSSTGLSGTGGTLVGPSGKPNLTSDAAVAAAQHLIDINPYALPTPLEVGFATANAAFLSGKGAMIETWTGMAQRASDPALSQIAGKWGAVALPLGGDNTTRRTPLNSGYGLGVSTASKHQAEALAFAAWATGTDEMLVEATAPNSAIDPNRTSVLNSSAYAAATPTALDLIQSGLEAPPVVWPKDASAPKNLQSLVDQLALAIEGKQDAETALKNAQASWA